MLKWLKYPENKPPSKQPTWYLVKMDDGTECQACAWFGDWYCFAEWYRIIEFIGIP